MVVLREKRFGHFASQMLVTKMIEPYHFTKKPLYSRKSSLVEDQIPKKKARFSSKTWC